MWEEYEIPYVTLPPTMSLVHVTDVFEKINSKGKPLNTFDLLIARLLKYGVELKDLWDAARADYPNVERYDEATEKTRMAIFQTMSLLYHPTSSCKRKDILDIYKAISIADKDQFGLYWKTCVEAVNESICRLENMRDGFGVRSEKDVPFIPAVPVLAALLVRASEADDEARAYEKIQQWYWSAAVMSAYSSGADSRMTSDFKEVIRWFDEDAALPRVVEDARARLAILDIIEIDEPSSSPYRAVLSLVALEGARDFVTGQTLEFARENQRDHIFPKAPTRFGSHKSVDSALNMTWMSGETNMLVKKAKKPSEYITEFVKNNFGGDESRFAECVETHLITKEAFAAMQKDDFDTFLKIRQEAVKRNLRRRIGGLSLIEEKLADNQGGAVDELEAKIRNLIDQKLSSQNANYWDALIPQGVRERVEEKLKQHLKRHPGEAANPKTTAEKLSFCDIMDYHEIIVSKQNWSSFEDRFGSRSELDKHFGNFKEYRNCIKHVRPMNNVIQKQGEASVEWIYAALR
jgi:hypothetical protein